MYLQKQKETGCNQEQMASKWDEHRTELSQVNETSEWCMLGKSKTLDSSQILYTTTTTALNKGFQKSHTVRVLTIADI